MNMQFKDTGIKNDAIPDSIKVFIYGMAFDFRYECW